MTMLSAAAALRLPLLATSLLLAACDGGSAPRAEPQDEPRTEAVENAMPREEVDPAPSAPAPQPAVAPVTRDVPTRDYAEAEIEAEYSPGLDECLNSDDAANGVSMAMGACFRDELRRQDALLNAAYQAAMGERNAAGKASLRAAERAWIKNRDEGCEEQRTGGTIDMVDIPHCLLSETVRRRLELEAMTAA